MGKKLISIFGIILEVLLFGFIFIMLLLIVSSTTPKSKEVSYESKLEKIIKPLVESTNISGGNCLNYTLYYKDYLTKNNPELDVRKIDRAGICKIGMGCGEYDGIPHTYLIVNGFGSECLLDQHQFACIKVVEIENG